METYKFDDLLKQEMKNPKFKAAFNKEYERLSKLKNSKKVVKLETNCK